VIIFMGVAGAGKSVQGRMLAEKLGYDWISTGELLRKNIHGDRKQEMLEGKLLGDDEIIAIVEDRLKVLSSNNRAILDGFPRTLPQAKWLLKQHTKETLSINGVVHLTASKEVVKQRLLQRGRPDDSEEAIDVRFNEYEEHTLPIVDWFKESGLTVYEIDGERDVNEIHHEIVNQLNPKAGKEPINALTN